MYAQSEKEQVAVLELDVDGLSRSEGSTLTNRLRSELVKIDSFTIVERSKMNEILDEQGFQMTGCTSSECAVQAGKLLSVNRICTGNIGKLGSMYTLTIRLIDVESGKIVRSVTEDCLCPVEDLLTRAIPKVAAKLAGIKNYYAIESNYKGETGDIFVKSIPEGAKIYLDGIDTKKITPAVLKDITIGTHNIKLEKGDLSAKQIITIKANELNQEELNLIKTNTGGLKIYSNPLDAEIYLNGKKYGNTPKVIMNLPYGDYRVVLKKNDDLRYEKEIKIKDNNIITIEGNLVKSAKLTISPILNKDSSIKNAKIYINGLPGGELSGKRSYSLYPGNKEIVIKNKNYLDWKKNIFLGENEKKVIYVEMEKASGSLSFNSLTKGSIITINDKKFDISKNNNKIMLPAGWHTIKISNPGFESKKIKVKLDANESKTVDLSLLPKTKNKAVLFSAVLPGLGQYYQEKYIRSWVYGLSFLSAIGGSITYTLQYNKAVNDYNDVRQLYEDAIDDEEIEKLRNEMNALYDDVNSYETTRNIFYGITAAVWLWNMIDVYYLAPAWKQKMNISYIMDRDKILLGFNYRF